MLAIQNVERRAASLTTVQKAGISHKAMEGMRDHLEQAHVGYQRTEPDATFMIDGLVGIYEAILRDLVVNGVQENVGNRQHLEARFPGPAVALEYRRRLVDPATMGAAGRDIARSDWRAGVMSSARISPCGRSTRSAAR